MQAVHGLGAHYGIHGTHYGTLRNAGIPAKAIPMCTRGACGVSIA